ncbi:MAG: DUF4446 family protein [Patescibacteria group bacterium]
MFNIQLILLIIIGIWALVLSVFVFIIFSFFKKLSKGIKEPDIRKTLDKILAAETNNQSEIKEIKKEIQNIKHMDLEHIQKMSLIRFNPFKEIGGDHSFSLALLDGKENGVIVTTLHTRDRTRVYAKTIKNGKSEFELSSEEKKALLKAQKS